MKLKSILGFVWLFPTTALVWLLYVLPFWAAKQIKYNKREQDFVWSFEVVAKDNWYARAWDKWAGWSGPCVYIFKKYSKKNYPHVPEKTLNSYNKITKIHELAHCDQQFVWGPFHYPAYFCCATWILLSNLWKPYEKRKHAHLDNPFEIDARKIAGQRVKIPREEWPDGPKDYNPWL